MFNSLSPENADGSLVSYFWNQFSFLATLKFMNKNKILSGGGKNLTGGGKWGWRGREVGGEGEGSGVKGGGKWGERGREVGVGYPPVHPLYERHSHSLIWICTVCLRLFGRLPVFKIIELLPVSGLVLLEPSVTVLPAKSDSNVM